MEGSPLLTKFFRFFLSENKLMSNLDKLTIFRNNIYSNFPARQDANMNILDAVSSYGHRCKSIVELSEANCFERQYTSITDGIADGLPKVDWKHMEKEVFNTADFKSDRILFVTDCTPNPRPSARTLGDRHITHYPNPAPGNKPICVGHEYSMTALIPEDSGSQEKHWLLPLSVERVKSSDKGHEVGIRQIEDCIDHCELKNKLVISIADSKYGTEYCRGKVHAHDNWVHLFRFNSTRNVYPLAEGSSEGAGNKLRYGKRMKLNDSSTHHAPDDELQKKITMRSGKTCLLVIKYWQDQVLRGSREFKGYDHPLALFQVSLTDLDGKNIYKNPLWLGLCGQRRHEIAIDEVFNYYSSRYDIEHVFRFGKDKLLFDSYETPDASHEESWWKLATLAYAQLYFSREDVTLLPKKWERYLASYQSPANQETPIATPSQTQRWFSYVLEEIGTPAKKPKPRGNPQGRVLGATQEKRPKKEIIFKSKPDKKRDEKCIDAEPEKSSKNSDAKKIDKLLKSVTTQLENSDLTLEEFCEKLLDSA